MKNLVNWFEISATDLDRAVQFYSAVLGGGEMQIMDMLGTKMAFLPMESQEGVGGALCQGEGYEPSMNGALLYLNGGDDLSIPLSKVEAAGGSILMPKTQITEEIGYMAIFVDSEGNKVAFHSQN